MLGQQSTAGEEGGDFTVGNRPLKSLPLEFAGIHLDPTVLGRINSQRTGVKRKNGCVVNTGGALGGDPQSNATTKRYIPLS